MANLLILAQTERLRKLSQLFTEGNDIFGTKKEFSEWLEITRLWLRLCDSDDLLKQPGGLDIVMDELYAYQIWRHKMIVSRIVHQSRISTDSSHGINKKASFTFVSFIKRFSIAI